MNSGVSGATSRLNRPKTSVSPNRARRRLSSNRSALPVSWAWKSRGKVPQRVSSMVPSRDRSGECAVTVRSVAATLGGRSMLPVTPRDPSPRCSMARSKAIRCSSHSPAASRLKCAASRFIAPSSGSMRVMFSPLLVMEKRPGENATGHGRLASMAKRNDPA